MTRRFFSGSSLDQAVMMAARHHGIDPEELAYRQIEKRHGFLRTRRAVVIEVDPERPRRELDAAADASGEQMGGKTPLPPAAEASPLLATPEDETERPPRLGEETERELSLPAEEDQEEAASEQPWQAPPEEVDGDTELIGAAERATRALLRFAGIDAEASAQQGEERIEVEIQGPDDSVLVVENGKGLLAIQHLLPRLLRGLTGRSSFVRVDSEGFHQKRKERLEELARKEADLVSRNGRSRSLPPMAPDERRIVHLALRDSPGVVTESRGSGLHKRVVVRPDGGDEWAEESHTGHDD
jgi:spoIIIJ-associated protein